MNGIKSVLVPSICSFSSASKKGHSGWCSSLKKAVGILKLLDALLYRFNKQKLMEKERYSVVQGPEARSQGGHLLAHP